MNKDIIDKLINSIILGIILGIIFSSYLAIKEINKKLDKLNLTITGEILK